MGDRCTGHCCKAFVMSASYEDMRRSYEAKMSGQDSFFDTRSDDTAVPIDRYARGHYKDIEIVFPMLVQLGIHMRHPLPDGPPIDHPMAFYTCKNLQANGDCGIYASRPDVCSDYPGRTACQFKGCTWDAARRGEHIVPMSELVSKLETVIGDAARKALL